MSTGPKNLAFGDWHSQLFSFAVTAVQKYERQHEGDDQSLHESKVYPPGKGLDAPQNQANAHLNLENSSLKKLPEPSGQAFKHTHSTHTHTHP